MRCRKSRRVLGVVLGLVVSAGFGGCKSESLDPQGNQAGFTVEPKELKFCCDPAAGAGQLAGTVTLEGTGSLGKCVNVCEASKCSAEFIEICAGESRQLDIRVDKCGDQTAVLRGYRDRDPSQGMQGAISDFDVAVPIKDVCPDGGPGGAGGGGGAAGSDGGGGGGAGGTAGDGGTPTDASADAGPLGSDPKDDCKNSTGSYTNCPAEIDIVQMALECTGSVYSVYFTTLTPPLDIPGTMTMKQCTIYMDTGEEYKLEAVGNTYPYTCQLFKTVGSNSTFVKMVATDYCGVSADKSKFECTLDAAAHGITGKPVKATSWNYTAGLEDKAEYGAGCP